ncbi:polyprenyl synthetase family protein [Angelakisella massiliensis]|uniref:polyprenyl synthetase family protein n=1 Tax=Angelakisella massiliensis TaxID=1871018 RepID=UPI0023A80032|nr:farnesyl diphosphate synthase [Angelakisella massiliensis]
MNSYTQQYQVYRDAVEQALPEYLPHSGGPHRTVEEAMAYSLLSGGKRLRGVLVLAFHEACGGDFHHALPAAAALEMVHAYSLIHDDLPCMDNDDLRRGKPSCHIQYGEAMALLAGDALLTHAFQVLSTCTKELSARQICDAVAALSTAAGTGGMIGGQVIDIQQEGKELSPELLHTLHRMKTGALIRASIRVGCVTAGASDQELAAADLYGEKLGLVFQIIDDILDVTATAEQLGKSVGSDAQNHKTTYVTLYGVEGARKMARQIAEEGACALAGTRLDQPFFREMARQLVERTK